ncbi:MAG: polyprenyl synthetase family protein [Candidatus Zixiibacteriota bacterium]
MDLKHYLDVKRKIVENAMNKYLPSEKTEPRTIHKAMRYSVFAGGKRLRPILAMASFELVNGKGKSILPAACALEFLHTYSLIHDDLPCMDDDDLRRGKPTLHKVFGEGMAVLAGDALHALAFEILMKAKCPEVVEEVVKSIGTKGMIGGQVADLEAEGKKITPSQVEYIHSHKTGALIKASILVGTILGDADGKKLNALSRYGEKIGLAFQITDDILDLEGEEKVIGKKTHADERKATYPKTLGLEKSKRIAEELIKSAKKELRTFGKKAFIFEELADFVVSRVN